jgi:LPS-assembly protein
MMRAMRARWFRGSPSRLTIGAWLLWSCTPLASAATDDAGAAEPAVEAGVPVIERSVQAEIRSRAREETPLARRYWVPRRELSDEVRAATPEYCEGAYVLPDFPHPVDSRPEEFPIVGGADRVSYWLDGRVELRGGVMLSQGNRMLIAREGSMDQTSGRGTMIGAVELREPGLVLQGERAEIDLESHAASLEGVEFLLPDRGIRGEASRIRQDADGNVVMRRGFFTRCEPGNRNWRISASSVRVEKDDVFGTARNAVVRVQGVPVFYTPYIRFPVRDDRQSGFLFPNVVYSEDSGLDVGVPYYLNLAPNYDATLMPRYIENRGSGLEGEFRYLNAWQSATLQAAYLHKDDLFDGTLPRDDFERLKAEGLVTGEFEPDDRWLVAVEHEGELGRVRTRIDYTAVSDRDYFRDLGNEFGLASRIELERRGEIEYAAGGLLMRLWAQRFDRLDEGTIDPYQRLPQVDLRYASGLVGPFEWSLDMHWASFDRENAELVGINRAVGERTHVEPRIRLPLYQPWGFLTFTGGYRHTRYALRSLPDEFDRRPDRGIGLASAHGGLFFERPIRAYGMSVLQTLEPQVYYLYQQYEDQSGLPSFDASQLTFSYSQLFRDNRFSGVDRIGDANQLSVGLTSRIVDARSGREYLRASLGQIIYFRDREVTLSGAPTAADRDRTSAVAGELAGRLTRTWRVTGTLIWDPNESQVDEGAIAFNYRRDNRHIANVGFRKRLQDDVEQVDLSAYWPLGRHYGFIGRWNYDLVNNRTIEAFGGLEYNDCCWQIRLVGRRYLNIPTGANRLTGQELELVRPDDGFFLQIVFKGMAGFGNRMEALLTRGIRGYQTENYQ